MDKTITTMKQLSFILILIILLIPIKGISQINNGYHGSIEAGYSINPTGPTISVNWAEINTIHGYQVNPYFFVGAGVGFHFLPEMKTSEIDGYSHWKRECSTEIPIFANFKWTVLKKKITPFVDLRLGHYVTNNSGLYESAGIGCRFALKKSQSIYTLVSYTVSKFQFQESYMIDYGKYDYKWAYKDFDESQDVISLKVGYEF